MQCNCLKYNYLIFRTPHNLYHIANVMKKLEYLPVKSFNLIRYSEKIDKIFVMWSKFCNFAPNFRK